VSSARGPQTSNLKVLLAGVSTRAAAESAARAGFDVTAIDAFADVDQHPSVRTRSLRDQFSADAAALRARTIACDAVAYGSNFENHPRAIASLAHGRALWGNPPDVVRRVRDPVAVADALGRRGLAGPRVVRSAAALKGPRYTTSGAVSPYTHECSAGLSGPRWLLKPLASGGGHGIRLWQRGDEVPRRQYLQELVDGTPASIVFVASGGAVVPIGFSRQLIGDLALGVSGYRYCGNIMTAAGEDDDALESAQRVAAAVGEEFGLVGVNGIDLIVRHGVAYAIEVNPRFCASMELVERAYGLSVFGAHAAACRDGRLPAFDLAQTRRGVTAVGKAVVFARRDVTVGDLRTQLPSLSGSGDLRDIPKPGTSIKTHRPVCTVFATGRDASDCRAELVRIAEHVYQSLAE
jgi:predicted ATP-grasp superfamily ATP-dependent carboligase